MALLKSVTKNQIALFIIVLLVAVLFLALLRYGLFGGLFEKVEKQKIEINSFDFAEVQNVSENHIYFSRTRDKVIFEGLLDKPTPCHTLVASYEVKSDSVNILIKAEASKEQCIQVITKTGYRGSFNYKGEIKSVSIFYNGELLNNASL